MQSLHDPVVDRQSTVIQKTCECDSVIARVLQRLVQQRRWRIDEQLVVYGFGALLPQLPSLLISQSAGGAFYVV